jgi:O-methyltransferase
MEFHDFWQENGNKTILTYAQCYQIYNQYDLCRNLNGSTAEIGIYQGYTSKMIASMCMHKTHYAYDTFEGIVSSDPNNGDNHQNGEFSCCLSQVKQNINLDNVVYKKGYFPQTFQEVDSKFCFVYSDIATYVGTKATLEIFTPIMNAGGKIMFYLDDKCTGVKCAIEEFKLNKPICLLHCLPKL